MSQRFRFTITFEVDKDGVPGWGNKPQDWIDLAISSIARQTHYNPTWKVEDSVVTLDSTGHVLATHIVRRS